MDEDVKSTPKPSPAPKPSAVDEQVAELQEIVGTQAEHLLALYEKIDVLSARIAAYNKRASHQI